MPASFGRIFLGACVTALGFVPAVGLAQEPSAPGMAAPILAQIAPDEVPPLAPGEASDPENCLLCHRFQGLARLDEDSGDVRLFFISEQFHADGAGPHAALACTGCHERGKVEKIPHDEVGAVDCAQTCHLVSASGVATDFSHKVPAESLARSVHKGETLAEQPFAQPLLRKDQSACLYCHDDPTYRMPALVDTYHRGVDPGVRCRSCHEGGLALDTERYLRHVGSRLMEQRPPEEAAQACAVCHSDPVLLEKNEQHDAVTSYLKSFHGKAARLGMSNSPVCVDCHAAENGDPHLMLGAEDAASPIHADNRQATCRSVGCHDNAAPELSDAAVHMRLQRDDNTIEYWVTFGFIALIFFEMTLDFFVVVLEALNGAFRPHNKEHRRLTALARAVQAHPVGRKRLSRMTVHERFQHWVLVGSFFLLVLSGLPMKFPESGILQAMVPLFGGLAYLRVAHRVAAVVISAAFFYHSAYLLVCAKEHYHDLRAKDPNRSPVMVALQVLWDWPLVIHPEDVKNYALTILHLMGLRKHRPAQGRMHFAQKFEYLAVFWGMAVIGLSGAMLWREDLTAEFLGGRALNFAYIVHSYEAFLALIYVVVVHFFAVFFSPSVFPLNLGSLTGDMPPTEMGEGHAGWLQQVADELGIVAPEEPEETGWRHAASSLAMRSYALFQAVMMGAFGVFILSFLVQQLQGPQAAIQVDKLPLRLDEALLTQVSDVSDIGPGGATRRPYQRGPLSHFHAVPTWYAPDNGNTCTEGGCHSPLPHGERKEVRAFLNMHTTFVDCQTCHREEPLVASEIAWLSLDGRAQRGAPAVLLLGAHLEADPGEAQRTEAWHADLRRLLAQAVAESEGDVELVGWSKGLEGARVAGVRYNAVVDGMRSAIGRHGHGEYGAKIGLPAESGKRWAPNADEQKAIDQLRGPGDALQVDQRKAAVEAVHQRLKKPEVECSLCHNTEAGLIDFAAFGYAPARVKSLRSNTIARQSQSVESGQVFFMPSVLGGAFAAPEAAPDAAPAPEVQP